MQVEKMVPEIYYKESRDFAYVGRIFEILFNYIKTNADCIIAPTDNISIQTFCIEMLSDTVGFSKKHEYDLNDLLAIIMSFQKLLRNKGSLAAVELAVKLMMTAQKIEMIATLNKFFDFDENDPFNLLIYVPDKLSDIILLEDLFDYILPAGMTYSIYRLAEGSSYINTDVKFDRGNSSLIFTQKNQNDEVYDSIQSENSDYMKDYHVGTIITAEVSSEKSSDEPSE